MLTDQITTLSVELYRKGASVVIMAERKDGQRTRREITPNQLAAIKMFAPDVYRFLFDA